MSRRQSMELTAQDDCLMLCLEQVKPYRPARGKTLSILAEKHHFPEKCLGRFQSKRWAHKRVKTIFFHPDRIDAGIESGKVEAVIRLGKARGGVFFRYSNQRNHESGQRLLMRIQDASPQCGAFIRAQRTDYCQEKN